MSSINTEKSSTSKLLSTKEVAQMLGVTPRFLEVRRLKGNGPPYFSFSSRCVRYDPAKVLYWQEQLQRQSTSDLK